MLKKAVLLLIVILVVSMIIGCSTGEATNPIELVPLKANIVGQINLSRILQDKDLTGIYDRLPKDPSKPQTVAVALDMVEQKTSIDLRGFDEGVFFADASKGKDVGTYSGIIVKGTFKRSDLVAAIEEAVGEELSTIEYKGYEIYTGVYQESALAFLGDSVFVIGAMDPVKDVIDVKKGDGVALRGVVLDTYNKLGVALIKVALAVPSKLVEETLEGSAGQLPGDLSAFSNIETVGLTLTKIDKSLALDLKLCAADSDSAQDVKKAVDGLVNFAKFMASMSEKQEGSEALVSLLNNLLVTKSDSCVDINLKTALSKIEDLLQSSGLSE